MVVINGLAMMAGSSPTLLANRGRIHPMNFDRMTTTAKDKATTIAICGF